MSRTYRMWAELTDDRFACLQSQMLSLPARPLGTYGPSTGMPRLHECPGILVNSSLAARGKSWGAASVDKKGGTRKRRQD
jgi:hypothetical protein